MVGVHGKTGDDMDLFHSGHPLFPFPAAVFGHERPDGGGEIDDLGVAGVKDNLIHERHVFLETDIVGKPMLAPVRTFINGIPHGAGIDGGRQLWVYG